MNLWDFEAIDWDSEEDEEGNLVHCLRHGVNETVVDQVLREQPVEVDIPLQSAEFAIVGPDASGTFWTLFLARSWKRGDWLRPVTGRRSKADEIAEWKRARGRRR